MNKIIKTVTGLATEIKKEIVARLTKGVVTLKLSKITTAGNNSRKTVDDSELQELADNIRQTGILQPVLVRPKGKKYEIVCGERRFRASIMAGTGTIPAIIRKLSDDETLEMSLIENLGRKNISPIEEAAAYQRLINTGRYDVVNLAVRFGKSETYIRNRMKLNDLTDNLLNLVNEDVLSISAALELCKYNAEIQSDIYEKHLSETAGYYDDWRNLSNREFITRLENVYCADLSRYCFDKSECAKCTFNTNCYTLFPENEGRCNNLKCLTDRNKNYLSEDKACKALTVTGNKTVAGYVLAEEAPENKDANPTLKLQEQDRRNKEIAVEKLVDDTRKYLRETDIPQSDFMEFEDDLLYFAMLSDLNSKHFTLFLENPQNKFHLTDEDKITIINSLTEEQKTLIRRDFLIKHLSDTFGASKKSYLMLAFARLHFPREVSETENRHNEVYQKRHARITERLEALNKVQGKQETQV